MRVLHISHRSKGPSVVAALLLTVAVASAQNAGWRRVSDTSPNQSTDPSTPVAPPDEGSAQAPANPPGGPIPSQLTVKPGTFVTVRINQPLSSDHNQVGDFFSGTLADPVVVDGIVVAQRGQTVAGRVSEVDKGGHGKGVSRLGVQLTSLTAVDGQQVPIQTQFAGRSGHSNAGRNVATVATATGLGAAIGSAADWGTGAAIGAGFGAFAGLAGVLLSNGSPAVLYPESLLTFQIEAPAIIATDRAPQAFRYVDPSDYQQPSVQYQAAAPPPPRPAPYYAPYPYPYPYPYYAYPYPYWGPSFGVIIGGPRFYYGRGFYGRGYYRGYRR